jgi:hypothetical protein
MSAAVSNPRSVLGGNLQEGGLIMGKQAAPIKAIALSSMQCWPFCRGQKWSYE